MRAATDQDEGEPFLKQDLNRAADRVEIVTRSEWWAERRRHISAASVGRGVSQSCFACPSWGTMNSGGAEDL